MDRSTRVDELCTRWEELYDRGEAITVEELCSADPDLLDEVRRQVAALIDMKRLLRAHATDEFHGADRSTPTVHHGPTVSDPFFGSLPCAFGRYQVLSRLGKGGMGLVYRAHDNVLACEVALKIARGQADDDPETLERFRREARAAAGLRHEGICRVLDFGRIDGTYYLAMDYVRGRSLAEELRRRRSQGPVDQHWVADLVARVAAALHHAHAAGIIHRDVKPGNILLDEHGQPRVADFGLARRVQDPTLTQRGMALGTPSYMSPEQIESANLTATADVYSLGVVLYELLTGKLPFTGDSHPQLFHAILNRIPSPPSAHRPDVDRFLEAICLTCLEKDPGRRYPSAHALAEALDRWLRGESVPFTPAPVRRPGRRRLRTGLLVAIPLLALATMVVFLLTGLGRTGDDPEPPGPDNATAPDSLAQLQGKLKQHQPVTLVGDGGLPKWHRWCVDEAGLAQPDPGDKALAFHTLGLSLLELVPDPQCGHYRLTAEVRHDDSPDIGEVGLFFGYQSADAVGQTCHIFYTLAFADRGINATGFLTPQGEKASAFRMQFRLVEPHKEGNFQPKATIGKELFFQAALPKFGQSSPWRRLAVEVHPEYVKTFWCGDGGELTVIDQQPLTKLTLHARALLPPSRLKDFPVPCQARTGLGLYAFRSAASFRQVVLEPLAK
jgi:serine/threonine-protein kinase